MKNLYEEYCNRVCADLKVSQRQCFSGNCHLKNFFDGTLMNIPPDTMNAISSIIHTIKIEEAIKKSRYGILLKDFNLNGKKAEIYFSDEGITSEQKFKIRDLNPDEILLLTLYRVVISSSGIKEIKIKCKLENQPEVFIDTKRERAIILVGADGFTAIKKDWTSIWDYFKPILKDSTFATKIRRFLNELTQENPLQGPPPPSGWMGKVMK